MSVYKDKRSPYYQYDFQVRGARHFGSTGCTSRREAERFEEERKQASKDAAKVSAGAPLTLSQATAKFWIEVGQHYQGGYHSTFFAALEWLAVNIGKNVLLHEIGRRQVSEAVARRRADGVSNATINRTVTEPLRRVMNRAKRHWEQEIQDIPWRDFLLAEPKERVRELRSEEEARLFAALRPDYRPVVRFALMSGCRLAECVGLTWDDIDWGGRTIAVRGKGKKPATIPLTAGLRTLLWPLQGAHKTAVFCYVADRADGDIRKGDRLPVTYEGLKTQWRRAKAAAKLIDFRFHDNRHTAATRLLRSSGNLKLVQKLLRHEDVATTTKYAHAHDEDLRRAMEQVENQTAAPNPGKVPEKHSGKRKKR